MSFSLYSDLLAAKTKFAEAAAQIEAWGAALIKSNPTAETDVKAIVSDVKQGASNMISYADTEFGKYLAPATTSVEVAVDTLLASLTKGASVPANPATNAIIDLSANALKAIVDAAAVKAKAQLAS